MALEWRDESGRRRLGQFVATSTRLSSLGMMQQALDEAEVNGTPIFRWCVLETLEPCDGRDGRLECDGEAWPIWNWCEERAQEADGWRSRDEIVALYRRSGEATWLSQHLCKRPDTKALIYSNFTSENITDEADYRRDGGPLYIGYDFGFTEPTHMKIYQMHDGGLCQFEELLGVGSIRTRLGS